MRSVVIAVSLALVLSAATGLVQAAAAQPRPAQSAGQTPARQPTAQPPAPAPAPPVVSSQGAKIGLVNLQQIAQLSGEGKASTAKVQALINKKQDEAAAKSKQLQDNQSKLEQSGALMNEAARTQLEKEVEKEQLDEQRFQQDAQAEITGLQTDLQTEFQKKLFPILIQLSQEKGLHVLLSAGDAGVIWAEPGIDLTTEAIKRFDAASAPKP